MEKHQTLIEQKVLTIKISGNSDLYIIFRIYQCINEKSNHMQSYIEFLNNKMAFATKFI